jgi:hypothetical protein
MFVFLSPDTLLKRKVAYLRGLGSPMAVIALTSQELPRQQEIYSEKGLEF